MINPNSCSMGQGFSTLLAWFFINHFPSETAGYQSLDCWIVFYRKMILLSKKLNSFQQSGRDFSAYSKFWFNYSYATCPWVNLSKSWVILLRIHKDLKDFCLLPLQMKKDEGLENNAHKKCIRGRCMTSWHISISNPPLQKVRGKLRRQ